MKSSKCFNRKKIGNIMNSISNKYNGEINNVVTNDGSSDVIVNIECDAFDIGDANDEFFDLLRMCEKFSIRKSSKIEDGLSMNFVFKC